MPRNSSSRPPRRRSPDAPATRNQAPARPEAHTPCPCGQDPGRPYGECCGPLHAGGAAVTARALMASRYSAFALRDEAYLLHTWHPDHRLLAVSFDPGVRWTGLEILDTTGGGPFHTEGTVEFRAHYSDRGRPGAMHELSRFTRLEGRWVYLDGTEPSERPSN